ncbi:fimbrial biogenesis outer membrane usher protein [Salmonella enterica subsp. enterica]|nr:fimbrial biogenesis outer membrane usher protein [Salmonella enterica subsp. enterica serovar Abaetetuba]
MFKNKKTILLAPYTLLIVSHASNAAGYFDQSLIKINDDEVIDISVFNQPNGGLEGDRYVSIYVNNSLFGHRELYFKNNDEGKLIPQLNKNLIEEMDIDLSLDTNNQSVDLEKEIPFSMVTLDQGNSRLDITIPQQFLKKTKLKSSPLLWDEGIPAVFTYYNLSGRESTYDDFDSRDIYGSFHSGFNFAGWRIRNTSNFNYSRVNGSSSTNRQSLQTFIEHDIKQLTSTFRGGELSTSSSILDNFSFYGGSIINNREMLKSNLYNYSPIVQGIANSYAEVSIKQNELLVYKTNVPPGPFYLEDLNLPIYGGDLLVTIKEADGTEHSFIQTYSTLSEMLRVGMYDYDIFFGKTRISSENYDDANFVLADYAYGLRNGWTVYGAGLFSDKYQAVGFGNTFSLGVFGAASTDVTFSRSLRNGDSRDGQSYNLKYSKSALDTGTTVTLASYRYNTKDFYSFMEHLYNGEDYGISARIKNRWSLQLSQNLNAYGHVSFTGNRYEYWNGSVTKSAAIAHSFSVGELSVSTAYSLDDTININNVTKKNKQLSLNLSLPFSAFGSKSQLATRVRYGMRHSQNNTWNNVSLYGKFNDNWDYTLQQDWVGNQSSSSSISVSNMNDMNNISASFSKGKQYSATSVMASGSIVAHQYGVTLSPDNISGGATLVHVDGVKDVSIKGRGLKTDSLGNAVISSLDFYNKNSISIDPNVLPDNVVIQQSEKTVYPSRGAIVLADYDVLKGKQVIFRVKKKDGTPIPFGSVVSLRSSKVNSTGIVGDDGHVYLAGIPEKGKLDIVWNKSSSCSLDFNLKNGNEDGIIEEDVVCK